MNIMTQIEHDLRTLFHNVHPHGLFQLEEYKGRLFITGFDEEANDISDEELLRIFEEAEPAALKNRNSNDRLWRSLAEGIRNVKAAKENREWRKATEESEREHFQQLNKR